MTTIENSHMMEIAAMAKEIYDGTDPSVSWEQADSADVEAALDVVLASARFSATIKATKRAREGLTRIQRLRESAKRS